MCPHNVFPCIFLPPKVMTAWSKPSSHSSASEKYRRQPPLPPPPTSTRAAPFLRAYYALNGKVETMKVCLKEFVHAQVAHSPCAAAERTNTSRTRIPGAAHILHELQPPGPIPLLCPLFPITTNTTPWSTVEGVVGGSWGGGSRPPVRQSDETSPKKNPTKAWVLSVWTSA